MNAQIFGYISSALPLWVMSSFDNSGAQRLGLVDFEDESVTESKLV